MKKKFSAFILVALLTISFTACGGKTDQGTDFESTGSVASDKQVSDNESDTSESMDITGADISSDSESTSADNSETSSLSSGSSGNSTSTSSKTNEPNGTSNTSFLASEPNNPGNSEGGNSTSKPSSGNTGSSNSSGISGTSSSMPTEKPVQHTHNFVDVGVQSMDWSNDIMHDDTGPTNTREKVSAVNTCIACGYYFGQEGDKFAERYYDHIWGPNCTDCGGAYTLSTVYACYHLLECSTPGCNTYKRGKLAYYKYEVFFDGNGNPPTDFILEDWQIEELGLPMP